MSGRRKSTSSTSRPAPEVLAEPTRFTATQAKNKFGSILETVLRGGTVMITKHAAPKAVLISIGEFNRLSLATKSALDALSEEFDAMLARMQTPKARSAMRAAFKASPTELGRAAVGAAVKSILEKDRRKAAIAAARKRA
jgi:antitoxin Phd